MLQKNKKGAYCVQNSINLLTVKGISIVKKRVSLIRDAVQVIINHVFLVELIKRLGLNDCDPQLNDLLSDADVDG